MKLSTVEKNALTYTKSCFKLMISHKIVSEQNKKISITYIVNDKEMLLDFLGTHGFAFHHASQMRGYISRKCVGIIEPYAGHFGIGFRFQEPSFRGTQYHDVSYFTLKNTEGFVND